MASEPNYDHYAKKMRGYIAAGRDLATEARFVDMIVHRGSRILDIGCGHGSAVAALRRNGHESYGIDPMNALLDIALEHSDAAWFRQLGASDLQPPLLRAAGLPDSYDLLMLTGNVPAFLSAAELEQVFEGAVTLLRPGGHVVIGTTVGSRGGPSEQDVAASATALCLQNRYADWHLSPFLEHSRWSVSVYSTPGTRPEPVSSDGIFVL